MRLQTLNRKNASPPLVAMPEPHPVASPQRPYGAEYRPRSMSNLTRPSNPSPSPLIQKDQWLKAAHESTEHFKAYGSPLPLVWVGCGCVYSGTA